MDPDGNGIILRVANENDTIHTPVILMEMENSAKARGTGISKRSPKSINEKMSSGNAVIATDTYGKWIGFAYIQSWSNDSFVSNGGMIVNPVWREKGVASLIKSSVFELSRHKYPEAKIFSITTGMAVMKLNSKLGFEPVTFDAITPDPEFWKGCESCVNFGILEGQKRKHCLCTAMLFDPTQLAHS